jgi:organic hydroperoxide reductase OsmC/OhrA
MNEEHRYEAHLVWDGARGDGTSSYASYGRDYHVAIEGKPTLEGSADPTFRGDAAQWNPEDMFLAALSACHMLTYLALCAKHGIRVIAYEDRPTGTLRLDRKGGGRFEEIILRPRVSITDASQVDRALSLHERAHDQCFIAASCSAPLRHAAEVDVAS